MVKKYLVISVVCLLLLVTATPAAAVLKLLEPELSAELREIAKEHIVQKENISGDAITIEDGWVREYWNVGVDVYMVVAVIDKGLATERKLEIPVRVDQKIVLSEAEIAALEEEDKALAPEEPVARILAAEEGDAVAEEAKEPPSGVGDTLYYLAAVALAALLLGTVLFLRRKTGRV